MAKANCSICGKVVARNTLTSRPQIICQPCRRVRRETANKAPRVRRPSKRDRICEVCQNPYHANYDGQRTCSRTCGVKIHSRIANAKPKPKRERSCRWCGRIRVTGDNWLSWCSNQCYNNGRGARIKGLYDLACSLGLGGGSWRERLVAYIAKRDRQTCQVCREIVDLTLKSGVQGNEMGPSLDHIIPVSLGGADVIENLQLTQWVCNVNRSNEFFIAESAA